MNVEDNTSRFYVEPGGSQPPIVAPGTGSGTQLFVINLCASIAPVSTTGRNIPGLENYRLYQVARVEDGRTRHRLRLGFFTNEAHAERVLTVVRQQYPTAFTTCLGDEDRRFTRGYLPESTAAAAPAALAQKRPAVAMVNTAPAPAPQAAAKQVSASVQAPPAKVAVPPAAAAAAKAAAAKPLAPKAPAKPAAKKAETEVVEMTWEPDEATKAAAISASLPKIKALTETSGLDDMSWDEPAPAARVSTSTTQSIKGPLAAGLLSGKFAALDTSKLRAASASKPAVTPPAAARPVTPPAPVSVPPKLDPAASVRVPALTFSDPVPTATSAPKSNAPAEPYHIGKGLKIEEVEDFELDLYDEPPPAKTPAAAAKATAPAVANKPGASKPAAKAVAAAPRPPVAKKFDQPAKPAASIAAKSAPATLAKPAPSLLVRDSSSAHPNLDSTQTIRALTTEEMNDGAQEKWFAIQLAASEQPVNLDTMPHLDIFEAYSLYSVATAGSGKIVHSLRLGFFKEAVSAEAVTGYLKTFFASPTVLRISVAEQARFKDAPQPKRSEPVDEPKNNVVDLNNARGRAPVVPTVTMEVVDPMATGSFRANATGAFKAGNGGTFKPGATGAFKPSATGAFKLNSTGNNQGLTPEGKIAAKSAGPATKRSEPTRASMTGKNKALKKSLADELLEEAREVELSESGIRKLPQNSSLLSRLLGKKK